MNIAFVAMSGIRVLDAELLRLGLTLPGFVERSKVIASLPSLGLLTLAGMTPERHSCRYLEIEDLESCDILDTLTNAFDLVAISSFSAQINEAYDLGDRLRQAGVQVVIGGLHATVLPDEAAAHCDAVVVGPGEACWPDVLADAEAGRLKPRYGSRDVDFDLADAPLPAFELLDIERYNRLTVQTSRGCPHHCEFCASSLLICPHYRQKPADRVLAEIDAICAIWPHPFIEFADDNTFVNHGYWKELLPELAKRNIRWFTETDISVASDPELLTLMRQAGCAQVLIGLESSSAEGLSGLELHSDWKQQQFSRYREAIHTIQSHGISVNGCFILGLDSQDLGIFHDVLAFVEESGLHEVQITLLTPFPGTPLYDRLLAEGRLLNPTDWRACTLFDVNYVPKRMSVAELTDGFRKLAVELYGDERTRRRRERFRSYLRQAAHLPTPHHS